MDQQTEVKKTAAQRIDDLEFAVNQVYVMSNNMAADLMLIKDAVKLLGKKVDAMVQIINKNEAMTDENIAKLMVEMNIEELKKKIEALIEKGILVPAEEISQTGFIVGQELDQDGKVVQPRTQFAVSALQPEIAPKILGKKAGDVIEVSEGKLSLKVMEVYEIKTPSEPDKEA